VIFVQLSHGYLIISFGFRGYCLTNAANSSVVHFMSSASNTQRLIMSQVYTTYNVATLKLTVKATKHLCNVCMYNNSCYAIIAFLSLCEGIYLTNTLIN